FCRCLPHCVLHSFPTRRSSDLELRTGQVLWGWPHCVQDPEITQQAIDRALTLIAFEAMNHWTEDGGFGLHVFHKNNELAGYCSVDRKSTRLNSSHVSISYAVFC